VAIIVPNRKLADTADDTISACKNAEMISKLIFKNFSGALPNLERLWRSSPDLTRLGVPVPPSGPSGTPSASPGKS